MTVSSEEETRAFISAARYGDLEEIQELLSNHGPSLLKCTGYSLNTPLHMASANGHADVVDFLLSRPEGCDVNQVNEAGNTALHWAALNGSLEVAKLLVGAGANVLLKNQMGRTSFYEAKQGGHEEVAEYLLELIDQAEGSDDEEESTESAQ